MVFRIWRWVCLWATFSFPLSVWSSSSMCVSKCMYGLCHAFYDVFLFLRSLLYACVILRHNDITNIVPVTVTIDLEFITWLSQACNVNNSVSYNNATVKAMQCYATIKPVLYTGPYEIWCHFLLVRLSLLQVTKGCRIVHWTSAISQPMESVSSTLRIEQ